jgi:hypothetical protein
MRGVSASRIIAVAVPYLLSASVGPAGATRKVLCPRKAADALNRPLRQPSMVPRFGRVTKSRSTAAAYRWRAFGEVRDLRFEGAQDESGTEREKQPPDSGCLLRVIRVPFPQCVLISKDKSRLSIFSMSHGERSLPAAVLSGT